MTYVKSWDTDVPVGRSQAHVESLLRRYGATGYTVSTNYQQGTVLIGFTIPRAGEAGADVEVRLPISFHAVLARLKKMPEFSGKYSRKATTTRDEWALAQAERVAWRQLLMFIEAGLNAADAGLQTLEEAFFAHTVMVDTSGLPHRMIDAVTTLKRLRGGQP